jgi:hypothetical protein
MKSYALELFRSFSVVVFLSCFRCLEEIKVGLCDHHAVCLSVYVSPSINF